MGVLNQNIPIVIYRIFNTAADACLSGIVKIILCISIIIYHSPFRYYPKRSVKGKGWIIQGNLFGAAYIVDIAAFLNVIQSESCRQFVIDYWNIEKAFN